MYQVSNTYMISDYVSILNNFIYFHVAGGTGTSWNEFKNIGNRIKVTGHTPTVLSVCYLD